MSSISDSLVQVDEYRENATMSTSDTSKRIMPKSRLESVDACPAETYTNVLPR